jgi:hypothetical protein
MLYETMTTEQMTDRSEDTMTTAVAAPAITALDRCDRCGAQAYVRVTLEAGGELFFCAHHARKHGEALRPMASQWLDETDRLTVAAATR